MPDIKETVEGLNNCGRKLPCRLCPYREHRSDGKCRDMLYADCGAAIYSDGSDAPITSHSERDILDACVELMQGMADEFMEYLEYVGYEPEEYEKQPFCNKTYFEIVQRLFLWNTNHSGGTSTMKKCKALGVDSGASVAYSPWTTLEECEKEED